MARVIRLSEPAATTITDDLGRQRLVVLGVDAHGRVWVNPDALNEADWQPLSKHAVESEQ